jgi:hypothetical protein
MHESEVTARPFKSQKKKVVFLMGCPVAPRFQDIHDVSHVSLVGTISLDLKSLPPLLLTTPEVAFKSRELIRLRDELFVFRTGKDYITAEATKFSINSMLGPYVNHIEINFPTRV